MRSTRSSLVGLSMALALSACGSAQSGGPLAIGERSGIIVDIGPAPDFDPSTDAACKRFAAGDVETGRRYATVQYFSGRHAHARVLPLATGYAAQVGDSVVFRGAGCAPISPP